MIERNVLVMMNADVGWVVMGSLRFSRWPLIVNYRFSSVVFVRQSGTYLLSSRTSLNSESTPHKSHKAGEAKVLKSKTNIVA